METTSPSPPRSWRIWQQRRDGVRCTIGLRSRAILPFLLLLILLQLLAPSPVWAGLSIVLAGILSIAAWWAWRMAHGVVARRELRYAWMQVGDFLEENFCLENGTPLPVLWMEVVDRSDLPGYSASTVRAAEPREALRSRVRGTCDLRGEYRLGPWEVRMGDPFNLFLVTHTYPATERILVYPPVTPWRPLVLPSGMAMGQAGARARAHQTTATVRTVREYVPGDPFHHVHWPTTARRRALHVREFDQETGGAIWLMLDMDRQVQVGSGERSTLEIGIILVASLALHLLETNRRVGLFMYGQERQIVRPAQGREHLWRILHVLALAHPTQEELPLAHALDEARRVLPAGGTLLLLTPSIAATWPATLARLQRSGVSSQVLFLAAGEGEGAAPLRSLLARLGVEMEVVDVLAPLQLIPPTGVSSRWEFKVLPTGQAVLTSRPRKGGAEWPV